MAKKTNNKSKRYRCIKHPDRFPAVVDKCWECLLGTAGFKKKFGELAGMFYEPDGPGYAGLPADQATGRPMIKTKRRKEIV